MKAIAAKSKFDGGVLLLTPGILALTSSGLQLHAYIARHLSGDWGDMSAADKAENDYSVDKELRIFSAYETPRGKIWIITEADRRATTILLPDEY